jgi:hypothetical protein
MHSFVPVNLPRYLGLPLCARIVATYVINHRTLIATHESFKKTSLLTGNIADGYILRKSSRSKSERRETHGVSLAGVLAMGGLLCSAQ